MRFDFLPRVITTAPGDKVLLGKELPTVLFRTPALASEEHREISYNYSEKVAKIVNNTPFASPIIPGGVQ